MNPQQKEFDTALANLTPQQRQTYMTSNPIVGVGGVQLKANDNGAYSTISSDTLTANIQPYNLPQQQTTLNNLTGINQSVISGIKTDASYTPPVETPTQKKESLFNTLKSKITGTPQEILAIQQDPELLKKKERATAVSNEIDQLDKDFRNEVKTIRENQQGKFGGGLEIELRNAQDRYENRRANIALTYKIFAGDYNGALEIANQKVQAIKDRDEQEINLYKTQVDEINNDLTTSEKMQLQANIEAKQKRVDSMTRAYEDTLKALQSSGQNVPSYVYDKVDAARLNPNASAADIYAAAGNYAVNLTDKAYKQAQTEKLISEISKLDKEGTVGTFDLSTPQGRIVSAAQNLASKYSSKFAQEQFLANVKRLSASGDVQQLSDYVFSEAISNIADTETRKKAFGNYRVVKQLNNLEQQLENYYSLGGDTNIFVGTKENMLAKIGTVQNTELRKIATSISNTLDELARARTGAVINEEEQKLYQSILPGTKKTANLNRSIISGLNNSLSSDIDSILKFQLSGSGFESIKDYQSLTGNNGQNQPSSKTQQPEIDRSNVEINGLQVRLPSGEFWNAPTLEALNKFKIKYGL